MTTFVEEPAIDDYAGLEQFTERDDDSPAAEYKPQFCIDTEERANWFLRKLGNIRSERARVERQFKRMIDDLNREEEGLTNRFQPELEAFARANLAKGKKTLHLLQGTCAYRAVPASVKVVDKHAALAYTLLKLNGEEFTRRELATDAYRDYARKQLEETGEILPGIEIAPARESFSIKSGDESNV